MEMKSIQFEKLIKLIILLWHCEGGKHIVAAAGKKNQYCDTKAFCLDVL